MSTWWSAVTPFDEAWKTRTEGQLGEHVVPFIGMEVLIRNKRASDRAKDRLDVTTLLAIASRKQRG